MTKSSLTAVTLPSTSQTAIVLAHPDGGRVVKLVNHWLASSGVEWTVKRLKSIRTASLQLRAGNHSLVRQIYQENSIAYTKGDLLPKGPFRSVVRDFIETQRPIVIRRLDLILRCYTALGLTALSKSQFDKAFRSITGDYRGQPSAIDRAKKLVGTGSEFARLVVDEMGITLRDPNILHLKPGTTTHGSSHRPPESKQLPYGKCAWSLVTSCAAPESIMDGYPEADRFRRMCIYEGADTTLTGHISCLQEAGAKARVVATPNAWYQWCFEPLHHFLDRVSKYLPESCVHDQNKGAFYIQKYLGEEDLFCFDLSSATDRFPRELQTHLLTCLGLDDYVEPLIEACQNWQFSTGKDSKIPFNEVVDYAVGQPMGLYGSFQLFHLTHYCLLKGLAVSLCSRTPEPFVVLGDDVLIRNAELALQYQQCLTDLGVEVSPTKSICSSKVAEFAGFVGVVTRNGVTTYRPFKHSRDGNLNNCLHLLHSLGHNLRIRKFRKWVDVYEKTRQWRYPDLSPLIPTDDDGGISPRNISPDRFANLLDFSSKVAYGQSTIGYMSPSLGNQVQGWRKVMEDLFDEQSFKSERRTDATEDFLWFIENLKDQERHGLLDQATRKKWDYLEDQFKRYPPSSLKTDPVFRMFSEAVPFRPTDAQAWAFALRERLMWVREAQECFPDVQTMSSSEVTTS